MNRIERHVLEDIYEGAGVSTPNDQDIMGAEFSLDLSPVTDLDLSASLTLLRNSGPDETYLREYYYMDGNGNIVVYYTELDYAFDPGSKGLFSLSGTWRPREGLSIGTSLKYFSSRDLYFLDEQKSVSTPGAWVLDASMVLDNLLGSGFDLGLHARNLLDREYTVPGTYTSIQGDPLTVSLVLRRRW